MIDILITYRDREEHLLTLVPTLRKKFKDVDHKITVIEQLNDFIFYKSILYNEGIKHTSGNILVFHDVDYIPTCRYRNGIMPLYYDYPIQNNAVYLPVYDAVFVNQDFTERETTDIPIGYREFSKKVDDDFYGGVVVMSRNTVERINGFNPLYMGWGLEDSEIRRRVLYYNIKEMRLNGQFNVLPHTDNNKGIHDPYYQWNVEVYNNFENNLKYGYNSQKTIITISEEKQKKYNVDQWIEVHEAEIIDL